MPILADIKLFTTQYTLSPRRSGYCYLRVKASPPAKIGHQQGGLVHAKPLSQCFDHSGVAKKSIIFEVVLRVLSSWTLGPHLQPIITMWLSELSPPDKFWKKVKTYAKGRRSPTPNTYLVFLLNSEFGGVTSLIFIIWSSAAQKNFIGKFKAK